MKKITNSLLIYNFINNEDTDDYAQNMSIEDNYDLLVLYSYGSPIAINFVELNKIIVNDYRYTMTTKKQIGELLNQLNYKYLSVYDVRLSLDDNIKILEDNISSEKEALKRKRKESTKKAQKSYIERLEDNLKAVKKLNKTLKERKCMKQI